jgi:hypothetical protein
MYKITEGSYTEISVQSEQLLPLGLKGLTFFVGINLKN